MAQATPLLPVKSPPDPLPPAAAEVRHVPWGERIAYGIGAIPRAYGLVGVKILAIPVYQMTLQVDPALLGLMMALPRFWDGFADPLIGHISDRSRSRFGRRRPFIVVGALLSAVMFAMIWMVPMDWSEGGKLGWFLVTSLLFYTCYSFWEVPYQSLGYELTPNYHERTAVMGVQNLFAQAMGLTINWIFPLAQLALFVSVMEGVRTVTIGVALVVFVGFGLVPALFVRERFVRPTGPAKTGRPLVARPGGLWTGCIHTLRNRSMLILMALVMLSLVASMFTSGLDFYLLVYYVSAGDIAEGSKWKAILSSCFAIVGFVSVWPLAAMSRRLDKRNTLMIIYAMVAVGGIGKWFFFREGMPWLCVFVPLLCGPVFAAHSVIAQSMLADVCDEDEYRHGERREGLYGAMHGWIGKCVAAAALFGVGVILNTVGFDAARGGDQDPSALLSLRIILVTATTVPALLALVVLRFYPLDEARMAVIRAELEARRGRV